MVSHSSGVEGSGKLAAENERWISDVAVIVNAPHSLLSIPCLFDFIHLCVHNACTCAFVCLHAFVPVHDLFSLC